MKKWTLTGLLSSLGALVLAAAQQTPPGAVELKEGDMAPAFSLVGSDGRTHKLSDYKGRGVVLAWFPKAFTGG
jgi:peroxiredoxin Q/BCP